MQTRIQKHEFKIRTVLEKLVHPSGHVNNEFQLGNLITELKQQHLEGILKLPVFHQWLVYAVNLWWTNEINPPEHILCFTLELARILTKNEDMFHYFNQADFFAKIVKICRVHNLGLSSAIKQSYIKFLSSLLEHESGFRLLTLYNLWEHFFCWPLLPLENLDAIVKFLEKMLNFDAKFCAELVKRIISPLTKNTHRAVLCSNDDKELKVAGAPLKRLGDILEYILDTMFLQRNDSRLLHIFSENFNVEKCLSDLLVVAQNENFTFDLCKIMFIMQFFYLYFQTTDIHKDIFDTIMINYIQSTVKSNPDDILKFCDFSHLYCRIISKKILSDEIINFGSRFVMILLQPSLVFTIKHCFKDKELKELQNTEISLIFQNKITRISGDQILRHLLTWRDFLLKCPYLLELCETSLLYVKHSRKHYSKQAAVITFEVLFYTVKGIVHGLQKNPENLQDFYHRSEYYCLIFENISIIIEEFHITWKDTIECVDLLSLTLDFLNEPWWSSEVVAAGLKVINIIIAKYIAPNLALLMDVKVDPNIQLLGSLLVQKLQFSDDCVKENALEIISSLVRVSGKKFPSLQKFLTDLEILNLVSKILIMDASVSIQINTIKCLEEIVKVRDLASQLSTIDLLVQKCEEILLNSNQAILRSQAADFITAVYEHAQLTEETKLNQVFVTMGLAVTNDLDWRVKTSVLKFWAKVIETYLSNQGMVDGSFPEVEFSKERRKIIILTNEEIQKRLLIVLDKLSLIGCLDVLSAIVEKDYDNKVRMVAIRILKNLKSLIKQYDVKNTQKNILVNTQVSPDYDEMITSNVCWTKNDIQTEKYMSSDSFLNFIENNLDCGNNFAHLNAVEDFEHILNQLLKI